MKFRFPSSSSTKTSAPRTSGSGIRALAEAIEKEGMEVMGVTSYGDLTSFAQQPAGPRRSSCRSTTTSSCAPTTSPKRPPSRSCAPSAKCARRNADMPIFLYGETRTSRHIPNDILRELHGFIHMFEDTPEFVARHIIREAKVYLDSLPPPFFKALIDYAQDGSYSWHCPGHSGGVAFLKSPVGQMFHQFFGENMLRADVCNAVEELGQLLDHTGPVAASSATPRASSMPTTCSSSPTARRRRTRWSGTPTWRRATSWWWTATATSRSCTRS
jgi:arginine decarboxylase